MSSINLTMGFNNLFILTVTCGEDSVWSTIKKGASRYDVVDALTKCLTFIGYTYPEDDDTLSV